VKRLGGAENFIKACRESSCIVDLGKKAQVDYVAQASIGKLRDKMRIKVEVYSVSTSGLVGMYDGDGKYFDDYFELLDAIEKNVPDIFKKIPDATPQYVPPEEPIASANMNHKEALSEESKNQKRKAGMSLSPLDIQNLIKKGFKKNKEEIKKESIYLSDTDADILYEECKKSYWGLWSFLNVISFGLGVGSYIQGDIKGGIIQNIPLVGIVVLSALDIGREWSQNTRDIVSVPWALTFFWGGLLFPYGYQRDYNMDLEEALHGRDISFSIDPLIIPKNGPPAVGLAFNFRY